MKSILVKKQAIRQHFADLELISQKQAELLRLAQLDNADEIIVKLKGLLEQRQELMNKIDLAQKSVKEEERNMPELQDPAVLENIGREEAAIFNSILAIQSFDEECGRSAERLLQITGKELSQVRKNLKALKSYVGAGEYSQSQFFDGYK